MTLAEAKRILQSGTVYDSADFLEACAVACDAIDKLEKLKDWCEKGTIYDTTL